MQITTPTSVPQMPSPAILSNPSTPWMISPGVFHRVQSVNTNDPYKKCEITNKDPEWSFVQSYFAIQSPENRHIGRAYCIHNGASTRQFEALIPSLEEEAKQPAFTPKWKQEEESTLRQKVNDRWKGMTVTYSPFVVPGSNLRKYTNVKILPLWHGTTAAICDSICKTGFTSFGNHALIQGGVSLVQKNDIGFFGNGIYFTNSARYAADIYSDGNLLLAWVSMREPYPVVADCQHPSKPKDMKKLEGLGHYENYNAHHIPVISINPANKKCAVYYPCTATQEAALDEIVVFQKAQALTRFWVELEVTLTKSLNPSVETSGKLLDQENLELYQKITRLEDDPGKIKFFVPEQLSQKPAAPQITDNPVPSGFLTWRKVCCCAVVFFLVLRFAVPLFSPSDHSSMSHHLSNNDIDRFFPVQKEDYFSLLSDFISSLISEPTQPTQEL